LNHAQDWIIQNDADMGTVEVTTIANGGVMDMYVIIGYDPKQVTSDYWNFIVGKPVLPPLYALGWNQCKWGYKTTQELVDVVNSYINNGIPLDN
jgi:alpha-glucosidase (family GH31 glycosyl hydrolase)